MSPEESRQHNNICPKCGKKLTIGVLNRVEELAEKDRPEGFQLKGAVPFKSLIPLSEIICELGGFPVASRKTWAIYNALIEKFGDEFNVMLDAPEEELKKVVDEKLAAAIIRNRNGQIKVKPGYDGEYGKPILEGNGSSSGSIKSGSPMKKRQKGLDEFF